MIVSYCVFVYVYCICVRTCTNVYLQIYIYLYIFWTRTMEYILFYYFCRYIYTYISVFMYMYWCALKNIEDQICACLATDEHFIPPVNNKGMNGIVHVLAEHSSGPTPMRTSAVFNTGTMSKHLKLKPRGSPNKNTAVTLCAVVKICWSWLVRTKAQDNIVGCDDANLY